MKLLKLILLPFAIVYWLVTLIRNFLYKKQILKSTKYSFPIINVGNLSMGGTGKTPHVEYLIKTLKDKYKIATLSRGYGRKSVGFRFGNTESNATQIGDEPMQYFSKFGNDIYVAVDEQRVRGMFYILGEKTDTELVILDDAFQHRAIQAGFSILLTTYNQPFYKDFIFPIGNLRESRNGKNRADCIIISKCPENLNQENKKQIIQKINTKIPIYFSEISYGKIVPFSSLNNGLNFDKVILVTGIAKPNFLYNELNKKYRIEKYLKFKDHHRFTRSDIDKIHQIFDNLANSKIGIITTEKDAMRLFGIIKDNELQKYPWFYQEIKIKIDREKEFKKLILEYVRKTRKNNNLY